MKFRLAIFALAAGACYAAIPGVMAQNSPCGSTYVMKQGDTLYQVTQQCRVRMEALLSANPQITNIRDIDVGAVLQIPGDAATNPDGSSTGSGISVQPHAGAPGTPLHITGSGYRPGTNVAIGAGPPQSEWKGLETARVASDGTVDTHVDIPDYARPGGQLVIVIATGQGETRISERIDIVAERDPDAPVPGNPDDPGGDGFTAQGRISSGVECPILTTPDGRVYSLTGPYDFAEGAYVRVGGELFEMSVCMQGEGAIAVRSMSETAPPAD